MIAERFPSPGAAIIVARTVSAVCRPASHLRTLLIRSRRRTVSQCRLALVAAWPTQGNEAVTRNRKDTRCSPISWSASLATASASSVGRQPPQDRFARPPSRDPFERSARERPDPPSRTWTRPARGRKPCDPWHSPDRSAPPRLQSNSDRAFNANNVWTNRIFKIVQQLFHAW